MICNKCRVKLHEQDAIWEHPWKRSTRRLKPVCKECHEKSVTGTRLSRVKTYNHIRQLTVPLRSDGHGVAD